LGISGTFLNYLQVFRKNSYAYPIHFTDLQVTVPLLPRVGKLFAFSFTFRMRRPLIIYLLMSK